MSTRLCGQSARARGFTLIEVMVALFITAVGLLGIAKIQALAYASTGSASVRSLVAMEAAGLAAAMHSNRAYWQLGTPPVPITITGAAISGGSLGSDGLPISPTLGYCQKGSGNTPCGSAELVAASDLHTYANTLNTLLNSSNPVTVINCSTISSGTVPINCTIQVTWNENAVAINAKSVATTTAATFAPTYTLYVEP